MIRQANSICVLLFVLLGGASPDSVASAATTTTFDFESFVIEPGNDKVTFPEPFTIIQDGIEMTISHENNILMSINTSSNPLFIARYGTRSLSPFNGVGGANLPGAYVLDFAQSLNDLSVDMGDFGQDADNLLLEAYSGVGATGTLLDSDTGTLAGGGDFAFDTLTVSANGIRSVRLYGGSAFNTNNNVFYDNIVVTAIPEPTSVAVLSMLAFAFSARHRRRARNRLSRTRR
jgi:hypothetical protein